MLKYVNSVAMSAAIKQFVSFCSCLFFSKAAHTLLALSHTHLNTIANKKRTVHLRIRSLGGKYL